MNKTKKENLIFIDGWEHVHCPVCGTLVETYDICDVCHWQNTGAFNIDGGPNKMTLAEAKMAYKRKNDINESQKTWEIDGEIWLHCPVCGTEVMDYDICDVCRWQNTGIINIDGGPNKMTLAEAKEAYARRKIVKIGEFDTVLLKNGQTATIVEKLSEDTFIADIGDSPKDWDTITITIDDIEKVVYGNS